MTKKLKENLNDDIVKIKNSKSIDPYKIIEDFFSAAFLDHYRKYISSMLKGAYSEDYWKISDPGSLLHFQEHMLNLIHATHAFIKTDDGNFKRKKKAILDDEVLHHGPDTSSYYGWHQGSGIWEFFPRNLTKEEFINPFKAFERFFEYKDIHTWLKEFKELVSFALESFGNETGIDYDYLEIHRQLQKLVEASHLIEVRVNMPKRGLVPKTTTVQETTKPSISDSGPSEELENYSSDPYTIIDQFFLDGTIEDGRDDLERFFGAAFPEEIISKKNYPTLLIYIYERIDKLIDAAFTLYQEWKSKDIFVKAELEHRIIPQIKTIFKKIKDWDSFPCKLKPSEWVNPRLAIKAFFEHQPLSHWKGKLHEFLQACVKDESICSVISEKDNLYSDCLHLERLVEAMWLIKIYQN
jgi:hypothetical protein